MLQGKYKVYNLCSERLYDASLFEGKVWVAYHFHIYSTPKAWYSQPPTKKKTLKTQWHICWCIKCSHLWQYFCCALMSTVWPCSMMNLLVYYIGKSDFVCVFQVACFPFDDHNCPPMQLVISFCHSAYSWLKEDIENVVVVHCKAGKARTGLMISSLLLFLKVRLPCIVSIYQSEWYLLQNLNQISYNWSFSPFCNTVLSYCWGVHWIL
jgi:hypothetical protein